MGKARFDYRALFEKCAEGMLVVTTDGDVSDANLETRKIVDVKWEDLIVAGREGVFDPKDSRLEPAFEELRRTGRFEGELCLLRRGWESFPAEVAMAAFGEGQASVVFRDLTQRKHMEEEVRRLNEELERRVAERTEQLEAFISRLRANERMLRESEERFRITFDQANIGIAHVAPDGRWLRVNRRLYEIIGYEDEELLGKTFQDITHPEDLDADLEKAERVLAGDIEVYSIEKRYFRKDGSVVWICLSVSLVREPSGDPNYFIAAVDNISERKKAQEQLRSLTAREIEILKLLAQGCTNRNIATHTSASEGTVKTHVQRIVDKLAVSNRSEAAARAVEIGLVEEAAA